MAVWEENKHPRDKSGQFTSKGNEGQGGSDKSKLIESIVNKMTENGTKEVNLNAGTISRASNGQLTEDDVHKWFEENDELEDYEAFDDDFDNDFEEEFVENIDNIDYDKVEENEKTNAKKGKNPNRKDKYGNELISDEAFKAGQQGAKAYLNYMTKYYDLDKLKKSNVFLGGLQSAASKAIIEGGYDPDLDTTYQDFNEIIGSVLGEEVNVEDYERNATKGFSGKKYTGYMPKE